MFDSSQVENSPLNELYSYPRFWLMDFSKYSNVLITMDALITFMGYNNIYISNSTREIEEKEREETETERESRY